MIMLLRDKAAAVSNKLASLSSSRGEVKQYNIHYGSIEISFCLVIFELFIYAIMYLASRPIDPPIFLPSSTELNESSDAFSSLSSIRFRFDCSVLSVSTMNRIIDRSRSLERQKGQLYVLKLTCPNMIVCGGKMGQIG